MQLHLRFEVFYCNTDKMGPVWPCVEVPKFLGGRDPTLELGDQAMKLVKHAAFLGPRPANVRLCFSVPASSLATCVHARPRSDLA